MEEEAKPRIPFIIGVAGGSASGKTSVCKQILKKLGQDEKSASRIRDILILCQSDFYKVDENLSNKDDEDVELNYDHPEAFDDELIKTTLAKLKSGQTVETPVYDPKTYSRKPQFVTTHPPKVILFEGILVLYNKEIRDLLDMKLFVDCDSDTRLARRVLKDTEEHGRDLDTVLNTYTELVKPAFEEFCLPTKKYADVIIPRGSDNEVAMEVIIRHITDILKGDDNDRKIGQVGENSKRVRPRKRSESSSIGNRPH
ncbi:uridine-cytidine kinase 2-like [Dendronephthya gigantea]|uniref:uridine-cytidine kinase 2-like n=1 Tax=Dendronephthya gigantea TaxID=151771 RepID=UPI00106ACD87|nr:uridine-cytidine kinase 2-like [Dendronephthya gigantea]